MSSVSCPGRRRAAVTRGRRLTRSLVVCFDSARSFNRNKSHARTPREPTHAISIGCRSWMRYVVNSLSGTPHVNYDVTHNVVRAIYTETEGTGDEIGKTTRKRQKREEKRDRHI